MKRVPISKIVQAATQSTIAREILAKEMKRRGLKKVRAGDVEARLVDPPTGFDAKTLADWHRRLKKGEPILASVCKVEGCDRPVLAKDMCQRHYGRARRGAPLDVEPRRGLVQLVIHVEPELKRWLKKTAKRDKVSVSQRASFLLRSEMDNLNGKHPF